MSGTKEPPRVLADHHGAAGLIIRQKQPRNLETPFDRLDAFLTPTELFYIRSHFPNPLIDPSAYRLEIEGAVGKRLSIRNDELRALPSITITATLECAGNGRVFLVPQVEGAQWERGAVGNAEWTGVPLADLLYRAGLDDNASEIILEGADRGTPKEPPIPPVPISYARSIDRAKALQPDVIVAYQMNGRDLTLDHGYPARAIVPGHYGMASVKWLTRVRAVRESFQGYWQTSDYAYWDTSGGQPVRRPLSRMPVKSQIARPGVYESIPPNSHYPIVGAAWSGEAEVVEVEVSTDGGQTWSPTEFLDPPLPHAWRRWKFDWHTPKQPGPVTLIARARDAAGAIQPEQHDPNFGTYVIHHPLPIEVNIRAPDS
jgi:DMSO/TMAO reductase YedYZ molybdopterin-dependent catalytic subunit